MVMITENSTADCVSLAVGLLELAQVNCYGEVGTPVEDSQYFRAYCYLCGEPIRVPRKMLGFPNSCSGCQPAYRGKPGVNEAERNFWFEQYYLDMADRSVNDQQS